MKNEWCTIQDVPTPRLLVSAGTELMYARVIARLRTVLPYNASLFVGLLQRGLAVYYW